MVSVELALGMLKHRFIEIGDNGFHILRQNILKMAGSDARTGGGFQHSSPGRHRNPSSKVIQKGQSSMGCARNPVGANIQGLFSNLRFDETICLLAEQSVWLNLDRFTRFVNVSALPSSIGQPRGASRAINAESRGLIHSTIVPTRSISFESIVTSLICAFPFLKSPRASPMFFDCVGQSIPIMPIAIFENSEICQFPERTACKIDQAFQLLSGSE